MIPAFQIVKGVHRTRRAIRLLVMLGWVRTVVEIVASLWARLTIRVCATSGLAPSTLAANGTIL